jgi:hypothetical protein
MNNEATSCQHALATHRSGAVGFIDWLDGLGCNTSVLPLSLILPSPDNKALKRMEP